MPAPRHPYLRLIRGSQGFSGTDHDSQVDPVLEIYLALAPGKRRLRFASTSEIAAALGRSPRTVRSWIEIGRIEAVRIAGRWQVDLESLARYLEERSER